MLCLSALKTIIISFKNSFQLYPSIKELPVLFRNATKHSLRIYYINNNCNTNQISKCSFDEEEELIKFIRHYNKEFLIEEDNLKVFRVKLTDNNQYIKSKELENSNYKNYILTNQEVNYFQNKIQRSNKVSKENAVVGSVISLIDEEDE